MKIEESIQKFHHNIFGNLSIIRSYREDGKLWFILKEIQNVLDIQNANQAIRQAGLKKDEIFILTEKKYGKQWRNFKRVYGDFADISKIPANAEPLFNSKTRSITFITESGFYRLVLRSRKPIADEFTTWVTREVLPTIRKAQELVVTINNGMKGFPELTSHLNPQIQKDYSSILNRMNAEKGIDEIWKFNMNIANDISEKKPYQWRSIGRKKKLPSKITSSGIGVLRELHPEMACAISLAKSMIYNGAEYDTAVSVCKSFATPLFNAMIENNIIPNEMSLNEKK